MGKFLRKIRHGRLAALSLGQTLRGMWLTCLLVSSSVVRSSVLLPHPTTTTGNLGNQERMGILLIALASLLGYMNPFWIPCHRLGLSAMSPMAVTQGACLGSCLLQCTSMLILGNVRY